MQVADCGCENMARPASGPGGAGHTVRSGAKSEKFPKSGEKREIEGRSAADYGK